GRPGGVEEYGVSRRRPRLNLEDNRRTAIDRDRHPVTSRPHADVRLPDQPPRQRKQLLQYERPAGAQANGVVERNFGRQAAPVRVEEEDEAAIREDRRRAVDVADGRRPKNGLSVPQVVLVLPRPI